MKEDLKRDMKGLSPAKKVDKAPVEPPPTGAILPGDVQTKGEMFDSLPLFLSKEYELMYSKAG
jgi:hypothetical protein